MLYHPNIFDGALVAVVVVLQTVEMLLFPKFREALARGIPREARSYFYVYFTVLMWAFVAAVAALWIANARPWSLLLLGPMTPWRLAVGLALAAAFLALVGRDSRKILRRPDLSARFLQQLQAGSGAGAILPHTARERRLFTVICITAGCCEEVLCRGFLLAFFASFVGLIAAVPVAAILFGLGHLYQGRAAFLPTTIFGLVMTFVALLSGSLIPVIIIHFAYDLIMGDLAYRLTTAPSSDGASAVTPAPSTA